MLTYLRPYRGQLRREIAYDKYQGMRKQKKICLRFAMHLAPRSWSCDCKLLTEKFVRNNKCLVGLEKGWIRYASIVSRVMIEFVSTKVPTPTELVVAYQTLIADAMQRRIRRRDSNHGVRTSLPRTPIELPYVHTFSISYLPSYAICTLRDGMSMKR